MVRIALFEQLVSRNILTVSHNRLKILEDINISMYGAKAWAFTLQEIGKRKGTDVLRKLGYSMGEESANEVKGIIAVKKNMIPSVLHDVAKLIEICGFGIVDINEEGDGRHIIQVVQNHVIDYSHDQFGEDSIVCNFYCGIYNGFLDVFHEKKYAFRVESCPKNKEEKCRFSANDV